MTFPVTSRELGSSTNRFKLGLFSYNTWGGLTNTLAPERWDASWSNTVELTQMAEEAGFEFALPLAGWIGHEGASPTDGHFYETLTWAAGLLQATSRMTIFATIHVPFVSPVFAAKQAATCDHIGRGRFGLNVVAGYNRDEFALMGIPFQQHDTRYEYLSEWLTIVKKLWGSAEAFDFEGEHFRMTNLWGRPGPAGADRPLIVSAGSSPAGRRFALNHVDALFMVITNIDLIESDLAALRASMADRPINVYASGHVICRATRKEAEEYLHYLLEENGDWAAGHYMLRSYEENKSIPDAVLRSPEFLRTLMSGHGTYRVIGSPDDVVATFERMSNAGLNGMAFSLPSYLRDFPLIRDEVLPRMEKRGLRSVEAR